VIVIASLFAAATVTAAIAASASAQNQNATESARAAVCAMCEHRTAMRVQLRHNRVVRVKTYGYAQYGEARY
jgi:anaerobic selenocysteine-containing dehydrogenase